MDTHRDKFSDWACRGVLDHRAGPLSILSRLPGVAAAAPNRTVAVEERDSAMPLNTSRTIRSRNRYAISAIPSAGAGVLGVFGNAPVRRLR
jgi:hypothetical protein